MRIDRTHTLWIIFVLLATVAAGLLFCANFHPHLLPYAIDLPPIFGEVPPVRATFGGTPLGLLFGTIAFLIFLFAAALGIRKKKRLWRIGNVQQWLKAHIWLTVLTIPLVLFHCGFHFGGPHTTWLVIIYGIVMASGFFGIALQQFMPRLMKERLPREVVFEQIPHIRSLLFEAALKLRGEVREAGKPAAKEPAPVAAGAEPAPAAAAPAESDPSLSVIEDFLDEECLPYLHPRRRKRLRLRDQRNSDDMFRLLKLSVSDKWQPKVADLQTWCDDRRRMDLQMKLHHWLHGWLVIHVPVSFVLLIWTAWHGWVAVRYLVIIPKG